MVLYILTRGWQPKLKASAGGKSVACSRGVLGVQSTVERLTSLIWKIMAVVFSVRKLFFVTVADLSEAFLFVRLQLFLNDC